MLLRIYYHLFASMQERVRIDLMKHKGQFKTLSVHPSDVNKVKIKQLKLIKNINEKPGRYTLG